MATLGALRLAFRACSLVAPGVAARRAGRLFGTPMRSTRTRALATTADGATCHVVDVDGQAIATYAWGDPARQPYVLFAHGWSSHGTRFQPWVSRLRAAGYAVLAFDQPAHGRSSGTRTHLPAFACTLFAMVRRHGPAAAVIGHSLGGAAVAVALARGLPAGRAILIAPAADPVDATLRFGRLLRVPERICRRMIGGFEAAIGITFEELQAHRNAPWIGCPALVVHDLEDREVPWHEGERYARLWPDARLVSTRGLGHNRIVDDADVIAQGVAFLRGDAVGERIVSSPNLPYGFA
ncbi:MAG TPA: alpha/beta fold hydrolase [Xanthomonadaceae bacterium]|nr:alpha/beta fold hydrolase [Xanthomonadaceae bacterium]